MLCSLSNFYCETFWKMNWARCEQKFPGSTETEVIFIAIEKEFFKIKNWKDQFNWIDLHDLIQYF